MFQYSRHRTEAFQRGERLELKLGENMGRSGYALDRYPIEATLTDAEPTEPYGWYESEKYFDANLIRPELSRPKHLHDDTLALAETIRRADSVSIHFRRTDLIKSVNHADPYESGYYERAIAFIRERVENPIFFIFSEDLDWCRENVTLAPAYLVAENEAPGREHEDLWLMSQCRHSIIANSTFSWWGSRLGEVRREGIKIAPAQWFKPGTYDDTDLIPTRWTRL